MAEDRRPTGIVAKRIAQSACHCPMQGIRRLRLPPGRRWRAPAGAPWLLVHPSGPGLDGIPARATALMPAADGLLNHGPRPLTVAVAGLAFLHPHAGDPLAALALPLAVADADGDRAWRAILAAAEAARCGDGWERVRCRGLVLVRLGAVLGRAARAGDLARSPRPDPAWLAPALATLRRRLHDPALAVADLAAAAGLTPDTFARSFRTAVGTTPWAMVLERRLERAEALLRDGLPVKTAAAQSGFAAPARLIAAFRRRHGCTPAAWAERAACA